MDLPFGKQPTCLLQERGNFTRCTCDRSEDGVKVFLVTHKLKWHARTQTEENNKAIESLAQIMS